MAIEPTSLTRIIKLLEDNGYIYKEKTTSDKREVIIKLTDKGLKSRNLSKEVVVGFNKKVVEKIDPEKFSTTFLLNLQTKDLNLETFQKR
jgi:DNA-binding MarR family transcriptional regulator